MKTIKIRHLSKAFDGHPVINDFSLSLSEGERVCLMAPSGSGKTTLFRILLGLLPKDSGEISGLQDWKIAAQFQEDRLIEDMDAVSNILLPTPLLPKEKAVQELSRFLVDAGPHKPVRELSGGMKRRVSLLRALLSRWDLLLLDEPFQGLDEETRAAVIKETLRLTEDKTVLLVTHSIEEAQAMNARVVTLDG